MAAARGLCPCFDTNVRSRKYFLNLRFNLYVVARSQRGPNELCELQPCAGGGLPFRLPPCASAIRTSSMALGSCVGSGWPLARGGLRLPCRLSSAIFGNRLRETLCGFPPGEAVAARWRGGLAAHWRGIQLVALSFSARPRLPTGRAAIRMGLSYPLCRVRPARSGGGAFGASAQGRRFLRIVLLAFPGLLRLCAYAFRRLKPSGT